MEFGLQPVSSEDLVSWMILLQEGEEIVLKLMRIKNMLTIGGRFCVNVIVVMWYH